MATIRKLPSGKYNVQVRREGQPPATASFATMREAKAWATKLESDIDHGKHFGFARIRTLADAIKSFTESLAGFQTCSLLYSWAIMRAMSSASTRSVLPRSPTALACWWVSLGLSRKTRNPSSWAVSANNS